MGIANDIVHAAIRELQLEGGHFLELRGVHGTLKVYKLDHSVHRIRRIRLDDLVSDTQFSARPSHVELVFQQVIIVRRQRHIDIVALYVKRVWTGASKQRTWHFNPRRVRLLVGVEVDVTEIAKVRRTEVRELQAELC